MDSGTIFDSMHVALDDLDRCHNTERPLILAGTNDARQTQPKRRSQPHHACDPCILNGPSQLASDGQ